MLTYMHNDYYIAATSGIEQARKGDEMRIFSKPLDRGSAWAAAPLRNAETEEALSTDEERLNPFQTHLGSGDAPT